MIVFRLSLKHVAEGGTLSEEVVSTIRTAQAFGTQNVLASLYDVPIFKAFDMERRIAVSQAFSLASFFFSVYAAYSIGKSPLFALSEHVLLKAQRPGKFGEKRTSQVLPPSQNP